MDGGAAHERLWTARPVAPERKRVADGVFQKHHEVTANHPPTSTPASPLGLRLPGVHWDSEGWLATTDSWAYVRDGAVHQWGPRDLFTELERACRWWRESGSPELYDFGLTVTAGGQTAWLGTPGSGRSWDL
ncbi:hypothetical protein ABZS71_01120 [Streptomyces sp. NPDC005393]|uniref:hypothetical protein n=1 Tax=Streptomyces sp. NPDC005393 TaxID=3157041 RepID=UPI0033A423FC